MFDLESFNNEKCKHKQKQISLTLKLTFIDIH